MKGALKGMILSALLSGDKTSESIYLEVSANEYEYEMPDGEKQKFTYDGSLNNIRVDILYLGRHGYIKKVNDRIPYIYRISALGKKSAENPFRYLEFREKAIKKAVESRIEELESQFASKVSTEVERRVVEEMDKINASNEDRIKEQAKELAIEVLNDGNARFRGAVREKATELMTKEQIPRGTKLFVGSNNMIELNLTNFMRDSNPLVIIVKGGKITESFRKE